MRTKNKKLNVRLLRRIQKHILAEPRRFMMAWWTMEHDPQERNAPPCGTVACIAGWAVLLASKNPSRVRKFGAAARRLLKLSERQANQLFTSIGWPDKFQMRWHSEGAFAASRAALSPTQLRQNAKTAADRIDHLIETGE